MVSRRDGISFRAILIFLLPLVGAACLPRIALAGQGIVSIIIDDIGYRLHSDTRAIELPGPLAYAILPHTPNAKQLAEKAKSLGKEVLLHLPMEATGSNSSLGPGALMLDMNREQLSRILRDNLAAIPHVVGVNNHMGSLLTQHPGHMYWVMDELKQHSGLFFVDSVTTEKSVAAQIASESGLPHLQRDVFLDHIPSPAFIRKQFGLLIEHAKRGGIAVGIAHPHPVTVRTLRQLLRHLDTDEIALVSLAEMLEYKRGGKKQWRQFSSRLPKVAKNSRQSPLSTCCGALTSKSSPPDSIINLF